MIKTLICTQFNDLMKKYILFFLIPFISYSQDAILSERPSFIANYLEKAPEVDGNIINDEMVMVLNII